MRAAFERWPSHQCIRIYSEAFSPRREQDNKLPRRMVFNRFNEERVEEAALDQRLTAVQSCFYMRPVGGVRWAPRVCGENRPNGIPYSHSRVSGMPPTIYGFSCVWRRIFLESVR